MLLAVVMWLTGSCTDDADSDMPANGRTRRLTMLIGTQQYIDTNANETRGSGDLPTSFSEISYTTTPIAKIQGYLTFDATGSAIYETRPIPCEFSYVQTDNNWQTEVNLEDGHYYFYGYMPKDVVNEASVSAYNMVYSKGAVLTLKGLNAVVPDDVCVIVGAKGYGKEPDNTAVPDMSNRLGKFDYHTDEGDKFYLLVDHIYAQLQFKMRLSQGYGQLRTIKVKSITLKPDNGSNTVKTVDVTAVVVANNLNYNPIVPRYNAAGVNIGGHVSFTTKTTGSDPAAAKLYEGTGKELPKEPEDPETFLACFCPTANSKFLMTTVYDVYDSDGNLIREDERADNAIMLYNEMTSGQVHTVNITVQPTYLFMLSDPDLDNPTFKISY